MKTQLPVPNLFLVEHKCLLKNTLKIIWKVSEIFRNCFSGSENTCYNLVISPINVLIIHYLPRLSGKFHPRFFPVEFAGIFRPGKYAQSGKYGKYGKYDFGLVIM